MFFIIIIIRLLLLLLMSTLYRHFLVFEKLYSQSGILFVVPGDLENWA